jgi:predicted tellurium resistance membrane protein TerC
MGVTSIINWVIAISLIGMVFGYFVLVLSTQRHNPIAWIGLTAMGLIAIGAAVGLVLAQVHSVDVVRNDGFLWILFALMVIQLIPQWTMTKTQSQSQRLFRRIQTGIFVVFTLGLLASLILHW